MFKSKLKRMIAMVVVCVLVCTLTACNTTLKGTYTARDGLVEQSFTFKEENRVKVSAFGINIEGDYVIEDGTITITYSLLGIGYDWVKSFEKNGDSIWIDGQQFVKQK